MNGNNPSTTEIYAVIVDERSPYDAEHGVGKWTVFSMHRDHREAMAQLWLKRIEMVEKANYRSATVEQRSRVAVFTLNNLLEG